jgi:hypothetical protein
VNRREDPPTGRRDGSGNGSSGIELVNPVVDQALLAVRKLMQ